MLNISAWGFHCSFTICPKDERKLLKDVWMFHYQIVQIKELLWAVLELLWVLKFSENVVVIIPTCWYQELLPCRDQDTANWWNQLKTIHFTEFRIKPSLSRQSQFYTSDMGYSVPCLWQIFEPFFFFFCQKVKKPQNKINNEKIHNIFLNCIFQSSKWLKNPASPVKGTRQNVECIPVAERAADTAHEVIADWRDPGQAPTEKLRELQLILIARSRSVNQGGSRKANEVTCISDQHRDHTQRLLSCPHPVLWNTPQYRAPRVSPGYTSSQAGNLAIQCELDLGTAI